ncbi:hypothetical protein K7432_010744 [Basidiobolus ranarum]|uniref:Cationic amino acid transporter C-terminal domain-containing protein n=1 Tax=Basidiobolus ranarum TaxID=34480 RepID=A0ABR2VV01_9FUNG
MASVLELVNIGVIILRIKRPEIPRKFKVPLGPYIFPGLGALMSAGLIITATPATLLRLFIWMALGVVLYFCYGRTHSVINNPHRQVKTSEIEDDFKL